MKFAEIVIRIVIDSRKLIEYILDFDNPLGRHKALVFERRLGFTKANASLLINRLKCLLRTTRQSSSAQLNMGGTIVSISK